MTSEHLPDESEYVQQLVFVKCLDEFFDFLCVFCFHSGVLLSSGAGTNVL